MDDVFSFTPPRNTNTHIVMRVSELVAPLQTMPPEPPAPFTLDVDVSNRLGPQHCTCFRGWEQNPKWPFEKVP